MRLTLISLFSLILAGVVLPADRIELTRTKAVEMALERNETLQSVRMEKKRVRGQYLEARAGAFPKINFSAAYTRNIDLQVSPLIMTNEDTGEETRFTIGFGTPHNYNFGFTLTQPLYAKGQVGAAIKIAKHGFDYTDARIESTRHQVSTQADQAYLDAVAAREAAQVYREAEHLADSNLAVVRKLYEQGQASEYDFLRAQVRASNSRPERIAAVNRARLAMDRLHNVLALPPETELVLQSDIDFVAVPDLELEELIAEALANRPELRQSREWVNINREKIGIEKGGYKPSVALTTSVNWNNYSEDFQKTSFGDDKWTRSWNVMLMLNWEIFSGFETVGKVRQARVDYHQSLLEKSQLERQIRLEVRDALGRVREADQRVSALGETVNQAERGVEIARVRYRNGVGTQLELLDAQVALTQSRVNRISALHDLAAAVADLRRAVGRSWDTTW